MIIDLNQFVADDFRLYIESGDVILLDKKIKEAQWLYSRLIQRLLNGFNVEMQLVCTTEKYL